MALISCPNCGKQISEKAEITDIDGNVNKYEDDIQIEGMPTSIISINCYWIIK